MVAQHERPAERGEQRRDKDECPQVLPQESQVIGELIIEDVRGARPEIDQEAPALLLERHVGPEASQRSRIVRHVGGLPRREWNQEQMECEPEQQPRQPRARLACP
jgi:hypothetical protein